MPENRVSEKVGYWAPPRFPEPSVAPESATSIRIGSAISERLWEGMKFEAQVFPLDLENMEIMIRHAKLDMVLAESTFSVLASKSKCSIDLLDDTVVNKLSQLAVENDVPFVFWMTKSAGYLNLFRSVIEKADVVFCSDPDACDALSREGIEAKELLPCIQPRLDNPFWRDEKECNLGVLFDGIADLDRFYCELEDVKKFKGIGLSIIESRFEIYNSRLSKLMDYESQLLGCVTSYGLRKAIKYSKVYLTSDTTLSTRTSQQWATLQAAACGVPIVHMGEILESDIRSSFVRCFSDSDDAVLESVRLFNDGLYADRLSQKAWRTVHLDHTFARRLGTIAKEIGIDATFDSAPLVSVIIPTYREHLIEHCVEMFERQNYPNKELILVYNGGTLGEERFSRIALRDNIRLVLLPAELGVGGSLRLGHHIAKGEYCFRMDDDDLYGDFYIQDMILHALSTDADLFGKPPSPITFEGSSEVFTRRIKRKLSILSVKDISSGFIWLGGNSFAGKKTFFEQIKYDDKNYGTVDSKLLDDLPHDFEGKIVLCDGLNLVAQRRDDLNSHTWQISAKSLQSSGEPGGTIEDFMV